MLRKVALLAVCITLPAYAAGPDPRQDWRSADTPHFRINYVASQRAQAERAAIHAESAYAHITQQLSWQPRGKTEILLLDAFDIPNGFSTPLPFNENLLFLAPPDEGELLHNHNWLDGLITHELTHTVHMDKARDFPEGMREIFGRLDTLFPNAVQPIWGIEGIATLNESTPQEGKGRLRGAYFEALMRIERERGFLSLSEINADGRALPTSKQYLYGVYFYDFLNRRYGNDAAVRYIHNYSDNILPRVHTNPVDISGKPLDELWDEFLTDLGKQVDARAAKMKSVERADGAVLLPAHYSISSLARTHDGVMAVVNDGLLGTKLLHIDAQGGTRQLARLRTNARIDLHNDGTLLIAQPDICDNYNQFYDLYLWTEQHGVKQITKCQRYRRAVWAGSHIAALKHDGGIPSLDILEVKDGRAQKVHTLYAATDGIEAIDLAADPNGSRIALIIKKSGAWQVLEFDVSQSTSRVLFDFPAPLHGLRYSHDGSQLEFIAVQDSVQNLWRHQLGTDQLTRLSHTHTGVTLHSGVAKDGTVVLGVIAAGGTELRHMTGVNPQAALSVTNSASTLTVPTSARTSTLGEAQAYSALRSIYPRSWLPLAFSDRGLQAYGISTYGSDAMRWHEYTANAMWEFSQNEPLGSINYSYLNRHHFSLVRDLWARQWTGTNGKETTTIYDRTTNAQWVSMQPWERSERRFYLGIGAAQQSTDRVFVNNLTYQPQLERVAAAFAQYDSRESAWYATEYNRGSFARFLFESYRPFNNYFDGHVVRVDAQKLWPIGKTVLSAHWTEAHASGLTEPFQLGGAYSYNSGTLVPTLNQRNLPLHGYAGSELALRGDNARTLSLGWQTPIADIDRAAMSPPVGINRLSATMFLDAGSVWNQGAPASRYYRGIGVELNAETKLFYQLFIPLSLGVAHGFDLNSGNRLYFKFGQTF